MTSRFVRWLVPIGVIVVLFAADQGTKAWARAALDVGSPVPVIDGFWDWELSFNPGAAFSLFGAGGARGVLTIVGLGALVVIAWMLARSRPEQRALRWALALIAAGAAGNLVDRIATGVVTDFVRWRWHDHRWPIFNVADVALLIGAALFLIDGWRRRASRSRARGAHGAG